MASSGLSSLLESTRSNSCKSTFIVKTSLRSCFAIPGGLLRDSPPGNCDPGVQFASQVNARGFSLIETALALAIIAFAFVGLMGLLPTGLTNFRSAMDRTIGAQIFQKVLTDAEQADFDLMFAQGKSADGEFFEFPVRYFDDQGIEVVPESVGKLSATEAARVVYHVHIRGSAPGVANVAGHSNSRFTSLPAATGRIRFNPRAMTFLTIQIADNPSNRALPVNNRSLWESSAALPMATYTAVVARNGSPRKI